MRTSHQGHHNIVPNPTQLRWAWLELGNCLLLSRPGQLEMLTKANLANWLIWEKSLLSIISLIEVSFPVGHDKEIIYWVWDQIHMEVQELAMQVRPSINQGISLVDFLKLLKSILRPARHHSMPRFQFTCCKQAANETRVAYWQNCFYSTWKPA